MIVNLGITIDGKWIEAQNDFPGLRIVWMGVGIVVLFFAVLFNRKSGRLRNIKLIPLSDLQISFIRLVPFLIFWILLAVVLLSFYLINFHKLPDIDWLHNIASITGIVLLINSIPIIYSDFYSTYFSRSERILIGFFWSILWVIYISLNIIFMTYMDFIAPEFFLEARSALTRMYFTPEATLVNVLIGSGLYLFSLYTFRKRKYYLE
jgi:hypothetical protein